MPNEPSLSYIPIKHNIDYQITAVGFFLEPVNPNWLMSTD